MRIRTVVLVATLMVQQAAAPAAGPLQRTPPREVTAIADALGFGFSLLEIADGRTPTLDNLDEFLDLAGYGAEPAANGWRRLDVSYQATKTSIHVGLGNGGATVWVRVDLTKVRTGDVQKTALLTKLKMRSPLSQGEYRISSDGLLSLYLGLPVNTVSEGNMRQAIRTLIQQADGTVNIWWPNGI